MDRILLVDDDDLIKAKIRRILLDCEYTLTCCEMIETRNTDFTPEREHGWYRKFEKNCKKGNLKR